MNLFAVLLFHCSGSLAQYVLRQPPSVSASLQRDTQIICSADNIAKKNVHWYQQKLGKPPVMIIYNDSDRPSGISDRYSGSNSGNTATLSIARAQVEDEADYYCQLWDSSMAIFGGGTYLTVLGQEPTSPKLSVYPPSPEEIKTRNKATLVCLMNDFYPGTIQVDWTADGAKITQDVQTAKPTKHGDKYISSSYLTLNSADWEQRNSYTCRVTHEGKSFEESIRPSECRSNP